jgi:hypothetical protein
MRLSPTRAAGAALLLATGFSGCGSNGETTTPVVVTVAVSPSPLTLNQPGATGQLTAALLDQTGRPISGGVTWSVQSAAVATVSGNGLTATVTGVTRGATLVIARSTSDTTRSGSVLVTVLGVISVVVSPKTVTLDRGATQTLNAAVTADPGVSTALTWRSSSTAISVSSAGLVRALNPGVGYVVAAPVAEPQKQDSALVTVPNVCLTPTGYTIGTTIAGSITAADCGGIGDIYRFTVASQTLYSLTVRSSILFEVGPLTTELGWGIVRLPSTPDSLVLHVLASPGAHQMAVGITDSTQRGPYTMSTQVLQALPATCPNVHASRGVSMTFTVGSSCTNYIVTQGPPTEIARALLVHITAAANAVYRVTAVSSTAAARLSLRQSLQTSLASAAASAAGSPAVLTYPNNTNSPVSLYLLIFGPNSGATTTVTVTIDP